MSFDLGDTTPLKVTVKDAAGVLVNATTITLTITLPDGTTVTPSVTNPPAVTGEYFYDYVSVQVGRHQVRWVTTGPAAAFADVFDVRPSSPGYIISLTDAKRFLNMSGSRTTDDEELREWIEATTGAVEDHLKQVVARRSVVEEHSVCYRDTLMLRHWPVLSLTSVTRIDATQTWTLGDLHVDSHGLITVLKGPLLNGLIQVVDTAGYVVVPQNFVAASKIILGHLWQTQRVSTLGPRTPLTEEDILTPGGVGFAIPHRAIELLGGKPPLVG